MMSPQFFGLFFYLCPRIVWCDESPQELNFSRLLFVINSQPHPYHAGIAEVTEENLVKKLEKIGVSDPLVLSTHHDTEISIHGAWTFFPLLERVGNAYSGQFDFLAVLEENTEVDLHQLKSILIKFDPKDKVFLGRSLKDKDNVVIHHYDTPGLQYPHGPFLLSAGLLTVFLEKFHEKRKDSKIFPENFSIDPLYELSKFLINLDDEEKIKLTNDKRICFVSGEKCALYPRSKTDCRPNDNEVIELAEKTLFAVKTCEKYHESRLPVVQETWGAAALNIEYFSETADPKYQTKTLPNVKNTEQGHCKKTQSIIEYFHEHAPDRGWKWLVIADDDTILSPAKILSLLKCYDNEGVKVHLGQRYGFRVATGNYGYDYITGGGGMVFNLAVVEKIVDTKKFCLCPKDNTPDDMHFGACLASLSIPLIHNPKFHQARPEDYHPDLIQSQEPVSFHKFWNTDPRKTYDRFFRDEDKGLAEFKNLRVRTVHEEL